MKESEVRQQTPHRPHTAYGPSIDRTPPHRLRATVMPEKPLQQDPGLGRLRTVESQSDTSSVSILFYSICACVGAVYVFFFHNIF